MAYIYIYSMWCAGFSGEETSKVGPRIAKFGVDTDGDSAAEHLAHLQMERIADLGSGRVRSNIPRRNAVEAGA
jgi:hypothetical protein